MVRKVSWQDMTTTKPVLISGETIKPSSPTPHSQRFYKLSFLDQLSPDEYVPIVLFYQNKAGDNPVDSAHRSNELKKSLSETLTRYYPLAGRIKDGGSVECTDEGVHFFEAQINCHLEELLKQPEPEALDLFVPDQIHWKRPNLSSLLVIQITFFDCGGMAIGLCMSHKVADLSSISTFINDWAATAHQSGEEISAQFVTSFFPSNASFIRPESEVSENCVTKRFVLDATKLAALKSLATSSGVQNPTRVEVATALLYKCAVAASKGRSGSPRSSVSIHLVNLRAILNPPFPPNSFGNVVSFFLISGVQENDFEFHGLVDQLKQGIANFRGNYGKKFTKDELPSIVLESIMEGSQRLSDTNKPLNIFSCSSWCRFPLYQVDFGWGKPIWVTSLSSISNNRIILMDTRKGDGIEALITLEKQDMAIFEHDEELLQFASLNPSILDTN